MNRWRQIALAGLALTLAGCSGEAAPTTRGVYLLMDTSGTYTQELGKAEALINAILAKLEPGDSFAVARVDTGSFTEKDIVAKVTFDDRPSMTNQQKRQFRDAIDHFVKQVKVHLGHTALPLAEPAAMAAAGPDPAPKRAPRVKEQLS